MSNPPRLAAILTLLALLLAGCATPKEDGDGDGVKDTVEEAGRVITIQRVDGPERRSITSDPTKADTDGDGLSDGDEFLTHATDPRDPDTDGDGLLDGGDLHPADDVAASWRAKGYIEVNGTFLGEADVCGKGEGALQPAAESSDGDGLADGEEIRGWDVVLRGARRHVTSDPCARDTDRDFLEDEDEKIRGTDPRVGDTDHDGASDAQDADPLWDLGIAFSNFTAQTNRSAVRIVVVVAGATASLSSPGNGTAVLDVADISAFRDSLTVDVIVTAEDRATGEPLALFADPRGAIVTFDVLKGTASGVDTDGGVLRFSGADGSASVAWETSRR